MGRTILETDQVKSHLHIQANPSTTWSINHALDCYPDIMAFDNSGDGQPLHGKEVHVDKNTVVLLFSKPLSGFAELSA